jgi:cytochrome b561
MGKPNLFCQPLLKDEYVQLSIPQRYSRPAIILHWLVAALIIVNVVLAWSLDSIPKNSLRPFVETHKSIGLTVLGLAIVRLLWRLTHQPPPLPPYKEWERRAAHAAHWVLYALIFLLPISGWMHDSAWKLGATHPLKIFFIIPWFRIGAIANMDPVAKEQFHSVMFLIHSSLAYVLYAMLAVHVVGALKHQFMERAPELQRMWFAQRRTNTQ